MDFMMSVPVAASSSTQRSGCQKRQVKNSLPRPFLVLDKTRSVVVGVVVCVACYKIEPSLTIRWEIGQRIMLLSPFPVTSAQFAWRSSFVKLKAAALEQVHNSEAENGGTLLSHLLGYCFKDFLAWPLDSDACNAIVSAHSIPVYFDSTKHMAKLIGVTPQPVDKYPDGHMEMADAVDTLFGPSLSNPGASAATEPGPSTSTTSTQLQMRLEGLCKLRKGSVIRSRRRH